tara:strand:+ start:701 stop:1300 length:600 start_codon:yes stop_codon:yes gene_type:complete
MYEYIIDIPIGGELKKHVIELAKISSEYDNIYSEIYNNYKNKKNIVHITLKYWFIVENEKTKLFDELKELTNKQKTFNVKINNIKTFNNSNQFVIFADVNRYKTGNNFIKKFMSILSKYDFVTWEKTDDKINGAIPHSTIAIVKEPSNIQPKKFIKLLKTKFKKSRGEVLGIRIRRRLINTKTNKKGKKELFKFFKFKK